MDCWSRFGPRGGFWLPRLNLQAVLLRWSRSCFPLFEPRKEILANINLSGIITFSLKSAELRARAPRQQLRPRSDSRAEERRIRTKTAPPQRAAFLCMILLLRVVTLM